MQNLYYVQTPENVPLEFELAGAGSRGVAVFIDTVIQNLFILIISIIVILLSGDLSIDITAVGENTLYIVLGILFIFITQFGYFLLFEYFMKGKTPGKKIAGLKVIMANGEPLSFTASLIRNLIRLVDMLPGIYGVGILSVFFSNRYMRIGDYAANTIVVKDKKAAEGFSKKVPAMKEQSNFVVSDREEALLLSYYERKKNPKNPLNSDTLEISIYNYFYGKIGLVPGLPNYFTPRVYLEKLMEYIGIE